MVIPPFVMHFLEYEKKFFCRRPWAQAPTQITLCCLCLMYITPLIRGLFPDWSPLPYCQLEECLQGHFQRHNITALDHQPYSPDLSPPDNFLISSLKSHLRDDCPDPSPCEKDEEPEPPVIDPCKKEEIENPPAEEEVQKEGAEESKTAKDEKPAEECKTAKDEKPTEGTEPSDDKNETKKKKIPFFENAYIRIRID
ncbi:hypothetical protein C0J52_11537 [Blattella germanica]|nr:hypothetical protein C0J52_11537 [Blattella germanica]